jgi:hypothetical protein
VDMRGITRRSLATLVAVSFGFLAFPTFGADTATAVVGEDIAAEVDGEPWLAIEGYDIVAYQNEGRSPPGKLKYQAVWHGAFWRFASKENINLFVKNPVKYAEHYDQPVDTR